MHGTWIFGLKTSQKCASFGDGGFVTRAT